MNSTTSIHCGCNDNSPRPAGDQFASQLSLETSEQERDVCSECEFAIEMVSEQYGADLFKYATEEERETGLQRLLKRVDATADGVGRPFYFLVVDANNEIVGEREHVSAWDGQAWAVGGPQLDSQKQSSQSCNNSGTPAPLTPYANVSFGNLEPTICQLRALAGKGLAAVVVVYRYSTEDNTLRIANHLLNTLLVRFSLLSADNVTPALAQIADLAYEVAAGLTEILEITHCGHTRQLASAAFAPLDARLEALNGEDRRLRMTRLRAIWNELFELTPPIAYTHKLPLNRGPFITYVAEAELAMASMIQSTML